MNDTELHRVLCATGPVWVHALGQPEQLLCAAGPTLCRERCTASRANPQAGTGCLARKQADFRSLQLQQVYPVGSGVPDHEGLCVLTGSQSHILVCAMHLGTR